MSYDIFFTPYRLLDEPIKTVNPFTGEEMLKRDGTISEHEVQAVQEVMDRWKLNVRTIGNVNFEMPDGGIVSISQHDYAHGIMVEIRGVGITPLVASLLHELLSAAAWTMLSVDENAYNIISSTEKLDDVNEDLKSYGDLMVCESPRELELLLAGGYQAWNEYRNKVVEG